MKLLKERIIRDGKCLEGGILKVDSFINHQMDPLLMKAMADEFVKRFAGDKIDKIITVDVGNVFSPCSCKSDFSRMQQTAILFVNYKNIFIICNVKRS